MLKTVKVICMCSSGSGMCWTVVCMPVRVRRKLRTVVYTHIPTHIPCLPLYVCAVPGPVCAGPWCACFSGFGERSGPWFTHIYIPISLVYRYMCVQFRVRCVLDRGVHALPGSAKASDRGLYTYTYAYRLSTIHYMYVQFRVRYICWTVVCKPCRVRRKLRTVVYTHIHTCILCVPGPLYAGPWRA